MIPLPAGLRVKRNKASEAKLVEAARAWITKDDRAPGVHASDLLDPRFAYWQRKNPQPIADRLVNTFLVGRVLHSFVLGSVDGPSSVDINASDGGSFSSDELGIVYSPDKVLDGVVRELKTSRSFYAPEDLKDLDLYIEQTLIYMVATKTTKGQIWVLYLNLRDETGKTAPTFRCFDIIISEAERVELAKTMRTTRDMLVQTLEDDNVERLPLCREFKCGARNCEHYGNCKPPGRYGDPRWDALSTASKVSRSKDAANARQPRGR